MPESFPMIYASVPKIACKGKCQASCGPIMANPREVEYFEKSTGKLFPDALIVMKSRHLECPMLSSSGGCSVYQHRPLICRLWGLVPEMKCPHGCTSDRTLSSAEGSSLLDMTA